jgi:hypothetical protein
MGGEGAREGKCSWQSLVRALSLLEAIGLGCLRGWIREMRSSYLGFYKIILSRYGGVRARAKNLRKPSQ